MYTTNADHTILYGSPVAKHPQPHGLYKYKELPLGEGPPLMTHSWIANVRLVDAKMYRAHLAEALDGQFGGHAGPASDAEIMHTLLKRGIAGKPGSGANSEGYSPDVGRLIHTTLTKELTQLRKHVDRKGRLGIISPNDCARFAFVLKNLIQSESGDRVRGSCYQTTEKAANAALTDPGRRVADMTLLKYPNGERHGITVVAEEPLEDQIVTLEAHADRYLLKPEFQIYDSRTMAPMLNTWFSGAELASPKTKAMYISHQQSQGVADVSVAPDAMQAALVKVEDLLGKWLTRSEATDKELWGLTASAAGVPLLLRG